MQVATALAAAVGGAVLTTAAIGNTTEPPSASSRVVSDVQDDLIPIDRVRNISLADLERRVRDGSPFIIEDAGFDNPFLGKDCTWYHETFPKAKMRAEYTGDDNERFVSIGGQSWLAKGRPTRPPPGHLVSGDLAKFNAPYVWHVKDGGHEAPPQIRADVQRRWRPAYFLRGAVNLREANESQEFWFSLRNGSVMAHADTYCIPAVSLQLRGKKRWRLMPAPPAIRGRRDRYDSHDGGLYKAGLWRPTHEAVVGEGEALIFFPHQFHETFVPQENPACTVATTFQFQHPLPVIFLRAHLQTLANSHLYYEGHCKDLWHSFSTFEAPTGNQNEDLKVSAKRWSTTADKDAIRKKTDELFTALDQDGNARVTVNEMKAFLAVPSRSWARWFYTEDYFYDWRPNPDEMKVMSEEVFSNRVGDTFAYHDADKDGAITSGELFESLLQWHSVHHKLKEEYGVRPRRQRKRRVEL